MSDHKHTKIVAIKLDENILTKDRKEWLQLRASIYRKSKSKNKFTNCWKMFNHKMNQIKFVTRESIDTWKNYVNIMISLCHKSSTVSCKTVERVINIMKNENIDTNKATKIDLLTKNVANIQQQLLEIQQTLTKMSLKQDTQDFQFIN